MDPGLNEESSIEWCCDSLCWSREFVCLAGSYGWGCELLGTRAWCHLLDGLNFYQLLLLKRDPSNQNWYLVACAPLNVNGRSLVTCSCHVHQVDRFTILKAPHPTGQPACPGRSRSSNMLRPLSTAKIPKRQHQALVPCETLYPAPLHLTPPHQARLATRQMNSQALKKKLQRLAIQVSPLRSPLPALSRFQALSRVPQMTFRGSQRSK